MKCTIKGVVFIITILFSMLGAALMLAAFAAGWLFGSRRAPRGAGEPPEAAERERLLAEQNAFRELLRYSPETAYGASVTDGEV